jgi:uncharacterized cupin superfamily protein
MATREAKTRGSAGGIQVEKPDAKKLEALGVRSWPTWEKEPSTFDWHYDEKETCYFLEGDVTVKVRGGGGAMPPTHEAGAGEVSFGKGDLVTFPEGLSCTWHVKKAVRKHYKFG